MTVKSVLASKGHMVVSMTPNTSLKEAVDTLAKHKIGALVVCADDHSIEGIISERDIVRLIAEEGASAFDHNLSQVMTRNVRVCHEEHTINEVMQIMTKHRFRHMPVEKDKKLIGIISIGDVVKARIEQVEKEADNIRQYIAMA